MSDYDPNTGRIFGTHIGDTEELIRKQLFTDRELVDGEHDGRTKYVKDGEIIDRPGINITADKTSIAADGQEIITISGLPEGECQVMLWGAVNDQWTQEGDIQLTANIPGAYQIRVSQWPYQEQEITFNAS